MRRAVSTRAEELGLDKEHVVLVQDELVARHEVAVLLADGGDHHSRRQPGRQLRQRAVRHLGVADGDLRIAQPRQAGCLDLGTQQGLEEVHAQDRSDYPDRVGDTASRRRVLRARHLDRGLECRGAGHRSGKKARDVGGRQPGSDAGQRHDDPCRKPEQGQKVGPPPGGSGKAGHELAPILDADAVEEHDKAQKAQKRRRSGTRHQRTHGKTHEEHGTHPERQAAQADLAQSIAQPDYQEESE